MVSPNRRGGPCVLDITLQDVRHDIATCQLICIRVEYKNQGYGLSEKKFLELNGNWMKRLAEAVKDYKYVFFFSSEDTLVVVVLTIVFSCIGMIYNYRM